MTESIRIGDDDEVVEIDGGVWARQYEDLFVSLLEEEVKKGNRKTTTLTKQAWSRIREEMRKNGRDLKPDQLKNKYNSLRQRWKDFSSLLGETGMGYNGDTGQLTASEETWQRLCKKYKTTKRFRKKGCKEYPKLTVIFGDTTATGEEAHPSTKSPSLTESEESDNDETESQREKRAKQCNGSKASGRKARDNLHSAMAYAFTVIGENSKRKLDLYEKRVSENGVPLVENNGGAGSKENEAMIVKCIEELDALEEVNAIAYTKAVEILEKSPTYRIIFIAMSENRKKDWVLSLGMDNDDFVFDSDEETEALIMLSVATILTTRYFESKPRPQRISKLTGHEWTVEILNGHSMTCYDLFRMEKVVFISLCEYLKHRTSVTSTKHLTLQEQVAIFLLIIGHNKRHRYMGDRFQHSTYTICIHFKRVLWAICSIAKHIIVPPSFEETPPEIKYNPKYKYFKNCIGAIDGTHISARVGGGAQVRFRGKRVSPTQNIMCVCAFNMTFTYVMVGWEGTTNDSRVFMETITKPENSFPLPPLGKYYVVDSGYTNMPGFLTLYRGERYHLRDFREGGTPQEPEEKFNYLHSSLRNIIERCFGVLKARFPILRDMPSYLFKKQKYIALACCVIHNFIRVEPLARDALFADYADDNLICDESISVEEASTSRNRETISVSPDDLRRMNNFRDRLAQHIWNRHIREQE